MVKQIATQNQAEKSKQARRLVLGWSLLLVLYFTTRLFNLMLLPIFVDETIHILWALQIAATGSFAYLVDVSRSFPLWILSLILPFFTTDLLLAARLVAVVFGFLGLLGCYWLGQQLFDHRVGVVTSLFYLVVPYTFFHDRIVLVDGLLATWAVYIVIFGLQVVRKSSWKFSLILGIGLALTALTKFNGLMLWLLPLMILVIEIPHSVRPLPWKQLILVYGIASIALIPNVLYFKSQGDQVITKAWFGGADMALWLIWLLNARIILLCLVQYLSPLILIAALLGIGIALIRLQRNEGILIGSIAITIGTFLFLLHPNTYFPRYLLPAVPFLLLFSARTLIRGTDKISAFTQRGQTNSHIILTILFVIVALPALWFDYWLLVNPPQASFIAIDRWQYIENWPAGYGIPETATYLRNQLLHSDNIVIVYDTRTSIPSMALSNALKISLYDQSLRVTHLEIDLSREDPDYLVQRLATVGSLPIFVVLQDPLSKKLSIDLDHWPYSQLVAHFSRPGGLTGVKIYRVSTSSEPVQSLGSGN